MKSAVLTALIFGLLLVSCVSTQGPIPADAPSEIYFQRAQGASDQNDYAGALVIYRTFLKDRPEANREDIFTARYEIALLLLKQGKLAASQADFEAILADYEDLEKSAGAPSWVKVLSTKKLQEIKDKAPKAKPAPAAAP